MPQDSNSSKTTAGVGRSYSGEASPPITTPEAQAEIAARREPYSRKSGAVPLHVYMVARGIDSPIQQASMFAYTDIRTATHEDFDQIFAGHHDADPPPAGAAGPGTTDAAASAAPRKEAP